MSSTLPLWLCGPFAALVLALALAAPLPALVGLDLLFVALPGQWRLGGVWVDAADIVNAGILLALATRGRRAAGSPRLPRAFLVLWLALGLLLSAAYLAAPENAELLTGPLRIGYQLYRYAWKPILYLPLYVLLLAAPRRLAAALWAAVAGADLCALLALPQGYHGLRASGPFGSPNTLGAVLVVPAVVSVVALLARGAGRRSQLFYAGSLLLIGRALLFAGSRGALMAVFVGSAVGICLLARRPADRARIVRAAPWALAGAAVLLLASPGLVERPNVQRVLTLLHPAQEETFRWRLHERWPHFWQQVEAHPWLGVGSEVDRSLGESANTPHNGYIAIAVASGIPALAAYLLFAAAALRGAWRASRREGKAGGLPLAAAAGAGLAGLLVHSSVDTLLTIPYVAKLFWLFVGVALASPRPAPAAAEAPDAGGKVAGRPHGRARRRAPSTAPSAGG